MGILTKIPILSPIFPAYISPATPPIRAYELLESPIDGVGRKK
jgi:hypothetical protein